MKKRLTGQIIKLLAFLLVMLQVMAIGVSAKDNVLSIYRNNPEESTPFNVTNMFPGDCETNVYNIRVSYNGSIKVYFTVDVRSGYEKLAEVLKCKVVMPGGSEPVYDGLMKEMPDLEHSISAVNITEDLKYEISVYLDTSVGNAYKNKELVADFKWWAYTSDEGHPGGGGTIKPVVIPGGGNKPITPPNDGDEPITPPDDGDEPIVAPPDGGEDKPVVPPDGDEPSDTPQYPQGEGITPGDAERPAGELINPPKTGDIANPVLWIVLICISLFIILLYISFKKKREPKAKTNKQKVRQIH